MFDYVWSFYAPTLLVLQVIFKSPVKIKLQIYFIFCKVMHICLVN